MSTIPSGYDSTAFLEKEALVAGITVAELYRCYMARGWSIEQMVSHSLLKQTAIPMKGAPLASNVQVGGNHYKQFPIQPAEFSERNRLSFLEASVVKRVCRHSRGGKGMQDIDKAIHELQLIKEFHYAGGATPAVQNTGTEFTVDTVATHPAVPADCPCRGCNACGSSPEAPRDGGV